MTRSSPGADLRADLGSLIGDEYVKRLGITATEYGMEFKGYEDMKFDIIEKGYKRWSKAISVASLITDVLGEKTTNTRVKALCGAFGVAATVSSIIPAGAVNLYTARGLYTRYITINGGTYVYNVSNKHVDYDGFEDADHNNDSRAYVDTGSQKVTYSRSSEYYTFWHHQIEDAYIMYNRMNP